MKIGILTIHDSPNYGANLQCYALWRFLVNQGYDCEVIDLHRPGAHLDYVPSKRYRRGREVRISKFELLKNKIRRALFGKEQPKEQYNVVARERFKAFNNEMKLSIPFKSIDQLYETPPTYDVYIAGSDQLWNPLQPYCIEPYFLSFVTVPGAKKISYATSIGITELTNQEKKDFSVWLSDFAAVSVRETQAKKLLESFVDFRVDVVMDPTFLLTPQQWKSIAVEPQQSEPYILLYMICMNSQLLEYSIKIAREAKLKLFVLNQLQPEPMNGDYIAIREAGPKEFLGYIGNADLVITDSFHGSVFALILGVKNFYSFVSSRSKVGSRIIDLLDLFEVPKHLLDSDFSQSYDDLNSNGVNHNHIINLMSAKRIESCGFLKKNING